MRNIYPVIMSGGSGTRLWPLSRKSNPKQFRALVTERTMLEETLSRVGGDTDAYRIASPTLICGTEHEALVGSILGGAGVTIGRLILEPVGRNTAPVAIMACLEIMREDPEGLVLLLPADHHVTNPAAFQAALADAVEIAGKGYLTTFGIAPDRPETGYGYIRRGEPLGPNAHTVGAFVEKPDAARAEALLAEGGYAWNAGIFLFGARAFLEEAAQHAREMLDAVTTAHERAARQGDALYLDEKLFAAVPSDSIDYAIMERTSRAAVIGPVSMGWNDIGSWGAVRDLSETDGETDEAADVRRKGDVISIDCKNTYLRSDGPTLAAIGVENIIVVTTEDAVLVAHADRSQDVKKVVEELKARKRDTLL